MNNFDNQEHQQKNKVEKTKAYSLTLHCVQIREPALTFDLLSKRVKYGYLYTSLCLSSPHFCQHNLNGADLWCHCFIRQPAWISATFPRGHCHVLSLNWNVCNLSCCCFSPWLRMHNPADILPFFLLLENEICFGSSPQQIKHLYLFAVTGNLKLCCSMSPILIVLKTGWAALHKAEPYKLATSLCNEQTTKGLY